MARQSYTWLISDTHFFHNKIAIECGWPIDHEQLFLTRCRYLMAPQDILIHLGDVIFYKYPKLKDMIDSVPGKKILVMGNHDRKTHGWYMRNGFDFACDAFTISGVQFSHKPLEPDYHEMNIHGHCHQNDPAEEYSWYTPGYHIKLDPAEMGFEPIRLDKIRKNHA